MRRNLLRVLDVNPTLISCPKCRMPGVLYSNRSIDALIGSRHVAHVLHRSRDENRRVCLLTRSEFERIAKPVHQREGRPQ
jgi:hypothetical protein